MTHTDPLRGASRVDGTFTLRPAGGGGFPAVAEALARKLRVLAVFPERRAVIVALAGDGRPNHYTQTLVDIEAGAWVEAASNAFIEPEHRLDDDQHRLLALFGFEPPDDEWSENHHLMLDPPVDWARVAWLLIGTLEDVYGVTANDELVIRIFPVS